MTDPRRRRLVLGGAVLALLVAVGVLIPVLHDNGRSSSSSTTTGVAAPPGVLRSKLVRETRPTVPASALKTFADAGNATAVDLYQQLGKTPGNVFFSPYSIETALGMAAAGARGETLSQMLALLHNRLSAAQFQDATNALNLALLAPRSQPDPSSSNQPLELKIANSEWSQAGYPVEPSFLDVLARDYGAALNTVDFGGDPTAAAAQINRWVAQHTNGKIKKLFDGLDPTTRLVLVNAVYFKASWQTPFPASATKSGAFTTAGGTRVRVPFMHGNPRGLYAAGDGWQAADLPYVGDASMTVVMPDAGTFPTFEHGLDAAKIRQIFGALQPSDMTFAMPKFQMKDKADLIPVLKALGMTDAFDNADFSGITNPSRLHISQVVHQATITVDERGTEAAAATGIGMTEAAMIPHTLTLDHPFLYFIRDTKTGAILFMGRVTDPTQTSVEQG